MFLSPRSTSLASLTHRTAPRALARVGRRITALAVLAAAATPALAAAAPPDPAANFKVTAPANCWTSAGTSPACIASGIATLNQARASLGQPAYALPSTFASLAPDQQVLVLSNLDRALYGIAPIAGLTAQLNADATVGAQADRDPTPSTGGFRSWASNWAGGFGNILTAYASWMYDDGPGSGNIDCHAATDPGCWGHRHNVLLDFGTSTTTAMGVSATTDSRGQRSYAQLLFAGNASYQPAFTYTWAQAAADGAAAGQPVVAPPASAANPTTTTGTPATTNPTADTNSSIVPAADDPTGDQGDPPFIHVTSTRHRAIKFSVTGKNLSCAVTRSGLSVSRARFTSCRSSNRVGNLRPGKYVVRVHADSGTATLAVMVTR